MNRVLSTAGRIRRVRLLLATLLLDPFPLHAYQIRFTDLGTLELKGTEAEITSYRGRRALKLTEKPAGSGQLMAVLRGSSFHNGTIDVDVAGVRSKTAAPSDRGFIGIAFRMQPDGSHYECVYIRPTNGRAEEQLRRNHSTEYESLPDWPWSRLRRESPGVYESYADMLEGRWIHIRILVNGTKAALYVGNASQPCLLVGDLKLGDTRGAIGLWGGSGTVGYFADLRILNTP
jgi:hypothetical protein